MQYLIADARLRQSVAEVAVTATTGVAAVQIGGMTLHRWAGIGRGDGSASELLRAIRSKRNGVDAWRQTRILFIDEISMCSGELFSALSACGSAVRQNSRPFGGLQLVVAGDFLQLPPVKFDQRAFETDVWTALFPPSQSVVMRKIYRQTDASFLRVLDAIRRGTVTDDMLAELNKCVRPFSTGDGIVSTKLFTRNVDVDELNRVELARLPSESRAFKALDALLDDKNVTGRPVQNDGEHQLFKSVPYHRDLVLKVDAQVMLLYNLDQEKGLVNGSRGVVVGFVKKMASSDTSRNGVGTQWFRANDNMVPLVKFPSCGRPLEIDPRECSAASQKEQVTRVQIPLALCWAVTVHKSQGLTLDRATLDLGASWAEGQAYTALSRVRSFAGLSLQQPVQRGHIHVSKATIEFYDRLVHDSNNAKSQAPSSKP